MMTTYDNSDPLEGWHVPNVKFCARLIGDDLCDCPSCQIDAAGTNRIQITRPVDDLPQPLDGRGDN